MTDVKAAIEAASGVEAEPEIIAVRIISDNAGVGPSNDKILRKQDGWSFKDSPKGVWCRRAPRSTLPAPKAVTFLYRIGHALLIIEYAP